MRELNLSTREGKAQFLKDVLSRKRSLKELFPVKWLVFSHKDTEPDKFKLFGCDDILTEKEVESMIERERLSKTVNIVWVEVKTYRDENTVTANRKANFNHISNTTS